jgi:hypothetical protein
MNVVMKTVNVRDEIVSIFGLLQPTKCHLGTRNVLLRILEVLELSWAFSQARCKRAVSLTRVLSSQVIPFPLFASV